MGLFKSKEERRIESEMKIRQGMRSIERSIRQQEKFAEDFIKNAQHAKKIGDNGQYLFIRNALKKTAAVKKMLERQLLAIKNAMLIQQQAASSQLCLGGSQRMSCRREVAMPTSQRGFASMNPEKRRELASKGGKAAHAKGTAHEWTKEEAREAGRKGGVVSYQRKPAEAANVSSVREAMFVASPDAPTVAPASWLDARAADSTRYATTSTLIRMGSV